MNTLALINTSTCDQVQAPGTPDHPYASPQQKVIQNPCLTLALVLTPESAPKLFYGTKVEVQNFDYMIKLGYGYADSSCSTGQGCNACSEDNDIGFGTMGLALNGVSLFSALSADYVDALYPAEWATFPAESLDVCIAHPNAKGVFHYHYMPACMTATYATMVHGYWRMACRSWKRQF